MTEEAKKRASEARDRAHGFAHHDAARRTGQPFLKGGSLILEAELSVMRRLLCQLHPTLRESGEFALARYWELVADEVHGC